MPKPAPSPERQALVAAHKELGETQQSLAQAEHDHQRALRAYGNASDTTEIDTRIQRLESERTHGVWQLRAAKNEGLAAAFAARDRIQREAYPAKIAREHASARLAEAERPIWHVQDCVTRAALAVARVEAEPVARATLARVLAAIEVLLRDGPDLVVLENRGLLPADLAQAVRSAGGGMLPKARDWPEFERRFHASPWRSAVDLLKQDPSAPLPTVPTS